MRTTIDGDKVTMEVYWIVDVLREKIVLTDEICALDIREVIYSCTPVECLANVNTLQFL